MKEPISIVPKHIDTDSNPVVINNGAAHDIFNARISRNKREASGIIHPVLGNELLPISNISGNTGETQCIGAFNNLKDDSVIYFVWDHLNRHKILEYRNGQINTLIQGDVLNFDTESPIISIDFYDKYLLWTDNLNPPRSIDTEKANRAGKAVAATVYFGQPDPDNGVVIFANGQEYYFEAFDTNGNPLFSIQTVLTADGTYEDDVLVGANLYADAFNANVDISQYFTAAACACGGVEITEKLPSGTDINQITTMQVSEGGIGIPAPTLLVYDNIYPDDITEFHLSIPKWTPKCNPTAVYKYDSNYENNFVNDKVFQFAVRYVYKENVKSCLSPISPIAVPNLNCHGSGGNYIEIDFSSDMLSDPLFLNEIDRVELFVRVHNEGQWGMATSLGLCELGLTRQFYDFYNDNILIGVSQAEIIKPFEYVPFVCKTLAIASEADTEGTRLFIGNGVEGYDKVCGDFSVVKDFFIPDGCPYTSDVEGYLRVETIFYDSYKAVVWWDGANIVFGGLGATVVNNLADDYKQVLPAKGFTVYLAGTNYYAITKQRFEFGGNYGLIQSDKLVYYDAEYGILDGSDAGKRGAIRTALNAVSKVRQDYVIKNVKHGQYALRVASHWCTLDGLYKGTPYRIDETLLYQKTSTYVVSTYTDTIDLSGGRTIANSFKEIMVLINYDSSGTGIYVVNEELIIADLTDGDAIFASVCCDGYLFNPEHNGVLPRTVSESYSLSYLQISGGITSGSGTVGASTDHNGFFIYAVPNTTGGSRTFNIGTVFAAITAGDNIYKATLDELTANLEVTDKYIPPLMASRCENYIALATGNITEKTLDLFVGNGMGWAFKNVLITLNCCNQYAITNESGQASLTTNIKDTFGNVTVDNDFTYYALGDGCCLNFEEWDDNGVITPNWLPHDITGMTNPITFYALPVAINPFSTWKYGGAWSFRVIYYDNQSRPVGITALKVVTVLDPMQSMNSVPVLLYSIPYLPPEEATTYQLVRTLNAFSYLQVVIGETKYYLNYRTGSINSPTNFQAGNAQEIHINLQSIGLFNNSSTQTSVNYEYKEGDSVTLLLYESGGVTVNPTYVNIPIRRQIGDYIVINNDYDLPFLENGMLIQINMPIFTDTENELYYEFGECHQILEDSGVKYHGKGFDSPYADYVFNAQDQDPNDPVNTPATGLLIYGDTWRYSRTMQTYEPDPTGKKGESGEVPTIFWTYRVESPSMSDYFLSDDTHIGRPYLYEPLAERKRFTRMVRFSNVYKPETQTTGLFNYEPLSYKNLPIHIGDVTKIVWTGDVILILGTIYPISLYIGRNTITDTADTNIISLSNSVIPQYRTFQEQLGRTSGCKHPLSVISTGDKVFWYDSANGSIIQYGGNQLFTISDKWVRSYFRQWKTLAEFDIIVGFDKPFQEILFTARGEENDTISYGLFDEVFLTRYSFMPEMYGTTNERMITFLNGQVWEHEKGRDYMLFYDQQSYFSIDITFNQPYPVMKAWASIEVYGRFDNETLGTFFAERLSGYTFDIQLQDSSLEEGDFEKQMDAYWSNILRDINSIPTTSNQITSGQKMVSNYLRLKIRSNNTSYFEMWLINAYFDRIIKTIK